MAVDVMVPAIEILICIAVLVELCLICALILKFSKLRQSLEKNNRNAIEDLNLPGVASLLSNLTFKDALNFVRARDQVEQSLLRKINATLDGSPDAMVIGIEVYDLIRSRDFLLAKFPDATQTLLKEGKAVLMKTKSGDTLLDAVGQGRIVGHARKVDSDLLKNLAQVGPLVVGGAHIIAGYDNAKKLKTIDSKLDVVISSRFRDMTSELESIYECIKESVQNGENFDRSHLHHLRLRLKHLRCAWVSEIESALENMENPENRATLTKWLSNRKMTVKKLKLAIREQEQPLYLIRFSLTLEQVIAAILGEHEVFESITLPDVRTQIGRLRGIITERSDWIAKLMPDLKTDLKDVSEFFEAFEDSITEKRKSPVKETG